MQITVPMFWSPFLILLLGFLVVFVVARIVVRIIDLIGI